MRITKIVVKKLFDVFDHEIPLNMEDRITIIHGKNGIGKTNVLKLINGFFNRKYSELRAIPFKEFVIYIAFSYLMRYNERIAPPVHFSKRRSPTLKLIVKDDETLFY